MKKTIWRFSDKMIIPAVVAHGGAGAGPERLENIERAIKISTEILVNGGNAIDAAVEGCVALENDPVFNAGQGSVFRTDGSISLDASIQTSEGKMGFVVDMKNTPNPIRVAADLLEEKINGLCGEGARIWADKKGHVQSNVEGREPHDEVSDTVGIITRDSNGIIVCATSTGGCGHRPPGRIGDVPLPGCGFWVQEGIGVGATGVGEEITRALLSYRVVEKILQGDKIRDSMKWALENIIDSGSEVGLIALGSEGPGFGLSNRKNMPWASWIYE